MGYLVKRFTRKLVGVVPEPAEVMWHNRAVLTSYTGFGSKAQKWDQLEPNLKSFRTHGGRRSGRMLVVPRLRLLRSLICSTAATSFARGSPRSGRPT
jgi:hypothetical protein